MSARPPLRPEPGDSTRPVRKISDFVPRSLGTRLALTYTGLALLIMAGLGLSLGWTIQEFFLAQVQSELLQETIVAGDAMAPLLSSGADPLALKAAADRLSEGLGARVTVVNATGTVLVDSDREAETMDNHLGRTEIEQAFGDGTGSSLRMSPTTGAPYVYAARSIIGGNAVIRLGIPIFDIDELVRGIRRQVFTAAVIAAVLMTGAGWFVASRIKDALDDIRGQVGAIAAGELHASVEPAATRELGDLGRAFNTMTARLRGTVTELERMRVRLEETLANLSDGVIITNERGHVLLANQSALTMLAVRGPVIGEPVLEVARDHELAEMVGRALATQDGVDERVIRHGLSGRILQAAARRLDAANERIGVVVLRDVTELRRLEGMRREFVANVSHELRTPLTSIRALVETLEAGALHDPSVSADFLGRIISEVDRLAEIVDELLDLARLESGRVRLALERIEPEALINSAVRRIAPQIERAGLSVEIAVTPGTPAIVGDSTRVDQVLLNLLHNAVKFTPPGGRITVYAASVQNSVEIQVRDTGVGVNAEELPRLFERFYKADRARRSEGTGLGLAIAKHIVQAHSGTIWAEQNSGGGTVFVFQLPVAGPLTDEWGDARTDTLASSA